MILQGLTPVSCLEGKARPMNGEPLLPIAGIDAFQVQATGSTAIEDRAGSLHENSLRDQRWGEQAPSDMLRKAVDIQKFGRGEIGDKAAQFVNKSETLKRIGFCLPKRFCLAEDFLEAILKANGWGNSLSEFNLSGPGDRIDLTHAVIPSEQLEVVKKILAELGDHPVAIRSSGLGDSRGIGKYATKFAQGEVSVLRGILQVLGSYFSPEAKEFRRAANLGEGFGIIIEPLIGHKFDTCIMPILSGFGYTSRPTKPGYICAVPGLGGGVDNRGAGLMMTKGDMVACEDDFSVFLKQKAEENRRYGMPAGFQPSLINHRGIETYTLNQGAAGQNQEKELSELLFRKVRLSFSNIKLLPLFSMMEEMEKAFGGPQYFEWAITVEDGCPLIWITQIADVRSKQDIVEITNDPEKVLFEAIEDVRGTGIRECHQIVYCFDFNGLKALKEFNETHPFRSYVLVYSRYLTIKLSGGQRLEGFHFNNAAALQEIMDTNHEIGGPLAHLGGEIEARDIFFGVIAPNEKLKNLSDSSQGGIIVEEGHFRVTAVDREGILLVSDF